MKKLLPKTIKNPQGFTLIELLVVIAIIAILSLIGLAIFTGLQARARNAKRSGDLNAILNGIEVNKAPGAQYYANILQNTWYSGSNFPTDPRAGLQKYCIYYSATLTSIPALAPAVGWPVAGACPSGAAIPAGAVISTSNIEVATAGAPITVAVAATNIISYMICALFEPDVPGGVNVARCVNSTQ